MLEIVMSNRFRKDLKTAYKRGYSIPLLEKIVDTIASEQKLDEKFKDHSLSGEYDGFRECHIQPDWLLIYKIDGKELILFLSRTGTHSDLFE